MLLRMEFIYKLVVGSSQIPHSVWYFVILSIGKGADQITSTEFTCIMVLNTCCCSMFALSICRHDLERLFGKQFVFILFNK